jgi:hypothetical protein
LALLLITLVLIWSQSLIHQAHPEQLKRSRIEAKQLLCQTTKMISVLPDNILSSGEWQIDYDRSYLLHQANTTQSLA